MAQTQEQEPFLPMKEHDASSHTVGLSCGSSPIARSSRKPPKTSLMLHATLVALYTICSIVAIHVLRKPYPRSCNLLDTY